VKFRGGPTAVSLFPPDPDTGITNNRALFQNNLPSWKSIVHILRYINDNVSEEQTAFIFKVRVKNYPKDGCIIFLQIVDAHLPEYTMS
jgi:hypothetical protein